MRRPAKVARRRVKRIGSAPADAEPAALFRAVKEADSAAPVTFTEATSKVSEESAVCAIAQQPNANTSRAWRIECASFDDSIHRVCGTWPITRKQLQRRPIRCAAASWFSQAATLRNGAVLAGALSLPIRHCPFIKLKPFTC
jgi:hypothetical protein